MAVTPPKPYCHTNKRQLYEDENEDEETKTTLNILQEVHEFWPKHHESLECRNYFQIAIQL